MIDHKNKIIFIHIPKCAGTSVEEFFGIKPERWDIPDYENLVGWCPKRKIHMQHATAKQLLELNLIKEDIWNSYTKFSIVRNPYSRTVSDYFWMMRNTGIRDTFKNYLERKGKFLGVMNNDSNFNYRGDHFIPQNKFIYINGECIVNHILKLEEIKTAFPQFLKIIGLEQKTLPKNNESKKLYKHYSHFYNKKEIEFINIFYKDDLEYFKYSYIDKTATKSIQDTAKIIALKKLIKFL